MTVLTWLSAAMIVLYTWPSEGGSARVAPLLQADDSLGWRFDFGSAIIGFVLGLLFSLALYMLRHRISAAIESVRSRFSRVQQRLSTGVEERYREQVTDTLEQRHLLRDYAALSEIYQPQQLIVPHGLSSRLFPSEEEGEAKNLRDLRLYDALHPLPVCVRLEEALRQSTKFAVVGPRGSGRTTLLAYLGQCFARGEGWQFTLPAPQEEDPPELIAERSREQDRLPVWVDLDSVDFSLTERGRRHTLVEPVVDHLSSTLGGLIALPAASMVRERILAGTCLLLFDNLDMLDASDQKEALAWLNDLVRAYPGNQYVVTAAEQGYEALWQIEFAVLQVDGFGRDQVVRFVERWEALREQDTLAAWEARVAAAEAAYERELALAKREGRPPPPKQDAEELAMPEPPPHLLDVWPSGRKENVLPLNLALAALLWRENDKVPAMARMYYAQIVIRALGRANDGLLQPPQWARVISMAAWEMQLEGRYKAPRSTFERHIVDLLDQAYEAAASLRDQEDEDEKPDFGRQARAAFGTLVDSGDLLNEAGRGEVRFVHPMLRAYFAGQHAARSDQVQVLVEHVHDPQWQDTIVFCAALADVTELVMTRLKSADDLFRSNFFAAASYLAASPKVDERLHGGVLAELAQTLMDPEHPMALGQRAAEAIATSGDKGALYLFGQAMRHTEAHVRCLGIAGLGQMHNARIAAGLEHALSDPDGLVRIEALHGYATLGGDLALDGLVRGLQDEQELVRQIAAELLAGMGSEGQQLLREGVESEDMYIRRAAVFGLGAIDDPWAFDIVDDMRREDDEWFVRSAATEVVERLQGDRPVLASPLSPSADARWLSAWASQRGLTASSLQEIHRAALVALNDEEWTVQLAGADMLAAVGGKEAAEPLLSVLKDGDALVREAAYGALYEISRRTGARIERPPAGG